MNGTSASLLVLVALLLAIASADAKDPPSCVAGCRLAGTLVDHTDNHGFDQRIWSDALCKKRDLYVYLPPNYDPSRQYPLLVWLHGFGGDEVQFLDQVIHQLDAAIVRGDLPPLVAAAPDGSMQCTLTRPLHSGSWFINSAKGRYEDYLVQDVMGFITRTYSIRPERDAHVIAGWSMGGFAAYNTGMKHPELFRILIGVSANLDLRHCDGKGGLRGEFDPATSRRFDSLKGMHVMGFYKNYPVPIYCHKIYCPVFGKGAAGAARMAQESPAELLNYLKVPHDAYDWMVAYGGRDEYNIDAQTASFVHAAREKGVNINVRYNPQGRHIWCYVPEALPDVFRWTGERLRALIPNVDSGAAAQKQ